MKKNTSHAHGVLWLCLLWSQAAEARLSVVMQRQGGSGFIGPGAAPSAPSSKQTSSSSMAEGCMRCPHPVPFSVS